MSNRSVQREDRRRRVLRDDVRADAAPKKRRSVSSSDRDFSDGALERNQPRITDFLPQRKMSVFKIFALGLGLVAVVESLYVLREQYLSRFAGVDTGWLNLHGSLNAASFVAAVMLLCAAVTATLIFHIRRHRMDDYRGRYRMWYPVIAVLTLAAGDVVTHAHRTVQGVAASLMPNAPLGNPASWWILAWVVMGGLLLMRATIDARKCKSALFFWCLSTVGLLRRSNTCVGSDSRSISRRARDGSGRRVLARVALFGFWTRTLRTESIPPGSRHTADGQDQSQRSRVRGCRIARRISTGGETHRHDSFARIGQLAQAECGEFLRR